MKAAKRIAVLACALAMCVAIAGCAGGNSNSGNDANQSSGAPAASSAKSDSGAKASSDAGQISIDGYEATYKGAEVTEDADGNPALVCNFTFTNNGKDAESFNWAFTETAFQQGVELSYAVVWKDADSYDTVDENASTKIQPGKTIDVSIAHKLSNTSDPVTLEFEDFWTDYKKTIEVDVANAAKRDPVAK